MFNYKEIFMALRTVGILYLFYLQYTYYVSVPMSVILLITIGSRLLRNILMLIWRMTNITTIIVLSQRHMQVFIISHMTKKVIIIEIFLKKCIVDANIQFHIIGNIHFAKRRIHRRVYLNATKTQMYNTYL